MMDNASLFLRFGTAIAMGFTIGLQREFSHGRGSKVIVAGERTFALIGLLGALAAMAADQLSSPAIFLSVIFLLGVFSASANRIPCHSHCGHVQHRCQRWHRHL